VSLFGAKILLQTFECFTLESEKLLTGGRFGGLGQPPIYIIFS
jgi:hypothetical protein